MIPQPFRFRIAILPFPFPSEATGDSVTRLQWIVRKKEFQQLWSLRWKSSAVRKCNNCKRCNTRIDSCSDRARRNKEFAVRTPTRRRGSIPRCIENEKQKPVKGTPEERCQVEKNYQDKQPSNHLFFQFFSSFVVNFRSFSIRLNEERFQQAGPLLDTASLCVACFNDAFAPDRDTQEGLLNLVSIAGHRRAVDIHNMLVDWLEEEAEAWIDGAAEVSGKERSSKKVTGKRRTYIRRSSTLRNFEPFLLEE
jgi:hypothetical protein